MTWCEINKPRDSDIHTIADFFELLCLTSIDKEVSLDDLQDHLNDFYCNYMNEDNSDYDVKEQIKWRVEAFDLTYAFELNQNTINLSNNLSDRQKIYLFLLLSANLPFIERGTRNNFTESFELLSLISLTNLTGSKATCKRFGKNNTDFEGSKSERLNDLFNKIGNTGRCDENYFRRRDSGDGGIDLVSWYEVDDYEKGNIMSILAQCACSRSEWSKKQGDVSYDRLSPLGQMSNRWNSMLFTPICFRDNGGKWPVLADLANNIVFDRLRIVNFIEDNELQDFSFPQVFDSMLNYSRSITE